ncbi:hypothetical protein H0H81_006308 [Sphagnurus paluster]|uniref:Uncharacterized protein n=1 Tax=Sphagnurus paluster TaxID=117069 RepID=A0A9P7K208_9AGAR|nr:hypothetical protein H0H81_006308 [Sphagnurus paluster]
MNPALPGSSLTPALPTVALDVKTSASSFENDANIDPSLLQDCHAALTPQIINGVLIPKDAYAAHLETIKRREPLLEVCAQYKISHAKRATLVKLRVALVQYWYGKNANGNTPVSTSAPLPFGSVHAGDSNLTPSEAFEADIDADEAELVRQYDVGIGGDEDELGYPYGVGKGTAEAALGSFGRDGGHWAG